MPMAMSDQSRTLLEVGERLTQADRERMAGSAPVLELVLDFEARQRSRLRATTRDGRPVGLFLERGTFLRDGDWLRALDGTLIQVRAAPETVSEVICGDPRQLARAAYHLGNRHVPLQVGEGWLRYRHDHVLDAMIETLGLSVEARQAPFDPEAGAYHGLGQVHAHETGSGHHHPHDHQGSAAGSGHET